MIADFDVGNAFTNGLHDSTTFVAADYWESTFGIFTRKSVRISMADLAKLVRHTWKIDRTAFTAKYWKAETYTSPEDLDSDFMGLGRGDFNIFNGQLSSSFPGNGSLPRSQLPIPRSGIRHTLHVIVFPAVSDIALLLNRS